MQHTAQDTYNALIGMSYDQVIEALNMITEQERTGGTYEALMLSHPTKDTLIITAAYDGNATQLHGLSTEDDEYYAEISNYNDLLKFKNELKAAGYQV